MAHRLDNPVWHALNSGNGPLAHGSGSIRFFWNDVSPFVGSADYSTKQLHALYEAVPFDGPFAILPPGEITLPPPWHVIQQMNVWQMVCTGIPRKTLKPMPIVPLGDADVPEMLKLTRLTNPGPFERQTIRFGHYEGIYDHDRLVAMAGQRMHPQPYAEISAVCTHPDFSGRGLATQLVLRQIHRIRAAGEIPFLHVKSANTGAIAVYSDLGFVKRKEVIIYVIKKG